ncbi:hypothetical protein HUJ04_005318 [Dendroctonus ponderosae]|nr:hypothetical protein HUJ04_005318 [Dendroctonus ponderosae]
MFTKFLVFLCLLLSANANLELWNKFKVKFNKNYASTAEHEARYEVFKSNLATIEEHNIRYEQEALNADGYQSYGGGIYNDQSCSQSVNHGVLVVGYGSESGMDYWIIKTPGALTGENLDTSEWPLDITYAL